MRARTPWLSILLLTGCPSPQPGINCWDLDGDRIDDPEEDVTEDGIWNAEDCTVYAETDDTASADTDTDTDADTGDETLPALWWIDAEDTWISPAIATDAAYYWGPDGVRWQLDATTGDAQIFAYDEGDIYYLENDDCTGTAWLQSGTPAYFGRTYLDQPVYYDYEADIMDLSEPPASIFQDGDCIDEVTSYSSLVISSDSLLPAQAPPDFVGPLHIAWR